MIEQSNMSAKLKSQRNAAIVREKEVRTNWSKAAKLWIAERGSLLNRIKELEWELDQSGVQLENTTVILASTGKASSSDLKTCTMNCGRSSADTRTWEEIKSTCEDCRVNK